MELFQSNIDSAPELPFHLILELHHFPGDGSQFTNRGILLDFTKSSIY